MRPATMPKVPQDDSSPVSPPRTEFGSICYHASRPRANRREGGSGCWRGAAASAAGGRWGDRRSPHLPGHVDERLAGLLLLLRVAGVRDVREAVAVHRDADE